MNLFITVLCRKLDDIKEYKWSLVHAEIMWYKNMRTDNFLENWNKFQAITDDNERQND